MKRMLTRAEQKCRDRIIELIESRCGGSQQVFADKANIGKSSVSQYVNGSNSPGNVTAGKIAAAFNVNPAWVMGFDVPKFNLSEDHPTLPSNAFPLGKYRIPIVATVAAGEPIYSEENIEGWIDFDRDPHGHVFACRIKGDSMTPRIHDGDIIVVDQESGWEDGDIVLVTVNGNDGTCKRIKKYADSIALISDNSAYAPMIYTAQEVQDLPIEVKGKVIEARTTF